MLAGIQYRHPVFEAKELHLWKRAMLLYYILVRGGRIPFTVPAGRPALL
jgi:hypothetical protein